MSGATMRLDTEDGAEVVAMIGRACAFLAEEIMWSPEELRAKIAAEVEDVIATTPRYSSKPWQIKRALAL